MEDYLSLAIDVPSEHVGWLSARLCELGFPAFEERASPVGARVIIYDVVEERLTAVRARLSALAEALPAHLALAFELGRAASDWALAWTEHLEPVKLTARLTLVPRAPTSAPVAGELYLIPAFAFGFGEHPSTRLSARWLERACLGRAGCSVLDVGSGTGVLALVARLSGAARVLGIDVSASAVDAARVNAQLNRVEAMFERRSVTDVDEEFDLVVANIEASVLLDSSVGISERLHPAGELALAGFIFEQSDALIRRYRGSGVLLQLSDRYEDWCLLVGRRAP